jgi:Ca2+-binding EF-hand superfamily protein
MGSQQPGMGSQGQQYGSQYYYNQINPQELQRLQASFSALDKDKSGEISSTELANSSFGNHKFSMETANLLVKVFDKDRSGQINFNEYASLFKFITTMQQAFESYDRDRSGSIEFNEVLQAIQQGGFFLSPQAVNVIYNKFLRHPTLNPGMKRKGLSLELFIQLCAFLGCARGMFMQLDFQRSGWITINLEQFVLLSANY